jgi:hypothetical protein
MQVKISQEGEARHFSQHLVASDISNLVEMRREDISGCHKFYTKQKGEKQK